MSDAPQAGSPVSRRGLWIILAGWVALLAFVIGGMFVVRERTLQTMSTPEAQAEWNAWRESEVNRRDDLPVKRRPPKSGEPPALVLMRDHFPVLLGAAVVFGSLLYGALAFAVGAVLGANFRPK